MRTVISGIETRMDLFVASYKAHGENLKDINVTSYFQDFSDWPVHHSIGKHMLKNGCVC